MLISVVVPIYNVENEIEECIESILRQTYDKLEVILVDDGSTDHSGAICDAYCSKDSRIKVIHQKNGGLSVARNSGIEVATGEYITFVDSDDYISENMIMYLCTLIERHGAEIAVCQSKKFSDIGSVVKSKNKFIDACSSSEYESMEFLLKYGYMTVTAWGKLYKRELFQNIRFPVGKYHEDTYTTYKLVAMCKCLSIGKEQLYFYRIRNGSIMTESFTPKHLHAVEGKLEQLEFVKKNFSKLSFYAAGDVIYAVNQCTMRLIKSDVCIDKYVDRLAEVYRKYTKYYIKGNSSFKAKIFTMCCCMNLRQFIKFMRIFKI